jgi:hypothetical protein
LNVSNTDILRCLKITSWFSEVHYECLHTFFDTLGFLLYTLNLAYSLDFNDTAIQAWRYEAIVVILFLSSPTCAQKRISSLMKSIYIYNSRVGKASITISVLFSLIDYFFSMKAIERSGELPPSVVRNFTLFSCYFNVNRLYFSSKH